MKYKYLVALITIAIVLLLSGCEKNEVVEYQRIQMDTIFGKQNVLFTGTLTNGVPQGIGWIIFENESSLYGTFEDGMLKGDVFFNTTYSDCADIRIESNLVTSSTLYEVNIENFEKIEFIKLDEEDFGIHTADQILKVYEENLDLLRESLKPLYKGKVKVGKFNLKSENDDLMSMDNYFIMEGFGDLYNKDGDTVYQGEFSNNKVIGAGGFEGKYTELDLKGIYRNMESMKGQVIKTTFKVNYISEHSKNDINIAASYEDGFLSRQSLWFDYTYSEGEEKIMDGDMITIYGMLKGGYYSDITNDTTPEIDALYIERL